MTQEAESGHEELRERENMALEVKSETKKSRKNGFSNWGRGQNTISKGPGSQYGRLCRLQSLCCNYSTLPLWQEINNIQNTTEWIGLCSNKTLFINTEIWISYHFNVSIFLKNDHFKMERSFLACRLYKHRPQAGFELAHSLSVPVFLHCLMTIELFDKFCTVYIVIHLFFGQGRMSLARL